MKLATTAKQLWEESFEEQIAKQAYNTAPVEALIRSVSYYLRDRYPVEQRSHLQFLELGCGAGPNLVWLAEKGCTVSGVLTSVVGVLKEVRVASGDVLAVHARIHIHLVLLSGNSSDQDAAG